MSLGTPTSLLPDHVVPGSDIRTSTGLQDSSTASVAMNVDGTAGPDGFGIATALPFESNSVVTSDHIFSEWFPIESRWTLDETGLLDARIAGAHAAGSAEDKAIAARL